MSCATSQASGSEPREEREGRAPALIVKGEEGERFRMSPDGQWVVYQQVRDDGRHEVWRMRVDGRDARRLGPEGADNRHPTFDLDGERVVFASDVEGDFDLWVAQLESGELEQVTDLEGDELEPDVSPLRYTFFAAQADECTETGASATPLDAYQKVAFTRERGPDAVEVWFASVKPMSVDEETWQTWREPPVSESHGEHVGRLSPAEKRCREPRWSGDGLSLVWECGGEGERVVWEGEARWEQSFAAAIEAVRGREAQPCEEGGVGEWREDECYRSLPRSYGSFASREMSESVEDISQVSFSANQAMLVGRRGEELVWRARFEDGPWVGLEVDAGAPANPSWHPSGRGVVFDAVQDGERRLGFVETDFYLQDVRNLDDFPELIHVRSSRLEENGFVARPGTWREFYTYYDKLRYVRRPAFITADAALQAFRDEFQRILVEAESRAADRLHALSGALYEYFLARYRSTEAASDLYLARYFAAGWVPLEAWKRLETPDEALWREAMWGELDEARRAEFDRLTGPVIERIQTSMPEVVDELAAEVRVAVADWVERMMAHSGVSGLDVPTYEGPFAVDFSQFTVRGAYAENDKGAYFLAMSWFSMAPLPFDESLRDVVEAMKKVNIGEESAGDVWEEIDSTVGAFMGRAVDPSPRHLKALSARGDRSWKTFDGDAVADALAQMVGPSAIRDANSAGLTTTTREIKVTFLPKRVGLDAEFFSRLTPPNVRGRGLGSALDVFAARGVKAAKRHALSAAVGEAWRQDYRDALEELMDEPADEGLAPTDIYHAWMATLVALAKQSGVPEEQVLDFVGTDAWADRKLLSALGGYAQLKDSAVLYAAQDIAVECGGWRATYVLVEQPILPQVKGFVDPEPQFFERLSALAGTVYEDMAGGEQPVVGGFGYRDEVLNAGAFAAKLAKLARKQMTGEALSFEEYRWIRMVGGRLEALSIQRDPQAQVMQGMGEARAERGVVLATDIQTNVARRVVRQVAVGSLLDLYVAVPGGVGRRMTQGPTFSFYEFERPMSSRLTAAEWHEMIEEGELPGRPTWSESFIQPVATPWVEWVEGDAGAD